MNVIPKVRACLTQSKWLKIDIYDIDEIVFKIWELEFPITVNGKTKQIYIEEEAVKGRLDQGMLEEILQVIEVLRDNVDEIYGWCDEI